MAAMTVQQIMKLGWEAYEQTHLLPGYVRDAVKAIIACRTKALGGHIQGCPDGHFQRQWYNSCKHRVCPQCAYLQVERWLQKMKARLLGCDHYHLIFTIPHELNDIWIINVKAMTDLLFLAVRDVMFDFIEDEQHVGGLPGMILSLHTWSQTLIQHIHIHCLVTAGGLNSDGTWREPKRSTLLPYKAVMWKFRGKLLDLIDKAIQKNVITLPKEMSAQQWANLKNKLGRKVKWNVHIRERYAYGDGVATYLSRYLRGGPIANHRLLSCENGEVAFLHRVNGETVNTKAVMHLPIGQFIQRYLLHVPPPRSQTIRHYGLYAAGKKSDLAKCRLLFGQLPVQELEFMTWQELCEHQGDAHPEVCPECGKRLVILETIPAEKRPVLQNKPRVIPLKFPLTRSLAVSC